MKRILAGIALSALMFATGASAAVTYEFSGTRTLQLGPVDPNDPDGDQLTQVVNISFTLTRPDFIVDGSYATDSCASGSVLDACEPMTFDAFSNVFNVQGDYLGFNVSNIGGGGGTGFYFFQPGAFSAVGTYSNAGWPVNDPGCCFGNAGLATLKVSGSPTAAIPEPGTWALMILGFGSAGAMIRRRRQQRSFAGA